MTGETEGATPPGWPAAIHLMFFALLIAVPLLLVTGALLFRATALERAQLDGRVVQAVQDIANDLDRDIDRHLGVLNTLAASPALAAEDWPAFYAQARASLSGRAYVILVDVSGRQVVNTYVPYGQAPAITGDPRTVQRMRETAKPVVSSLFVSLVAKEPVYNISIPIERAGELRFVLSVGLKPRNLFELLRAQNLPENWTAAIWDENGIILARSWDHDRIVGTAMAPRLRSQPEATVFRATGIDGVDILGANGASGLSGWRIGVTFPATIVDRQLRDSLLYWGGTIAFAAAVVLVLAFVFGRRLTRPLAEATAAAGALGRRQLFTIEDSRLLEANAVIAALRTAARDLDENSAALRDSEERLRAAAEAAQFGAHEYDVAADHAIRSPEMRRLLGAEDTGRRPTFESGLAFVHPDDRETVRRHKQQILAGVEERYELEYRIRRPDGAVRWVMDRGQVIRDGQHKAQRVVGVLLDISRLKAAEQRQRLLFDELNHRVKNTLAIVQSLAQQTLRTTPDPKAFAHAFGDRLRALAGAHNLLTQEAWRGAPLREIVATAMAPFIDEGRDIRIVGPAVMVPAGATVTLSLMLHELASNAAKYGSFSVSEGRLSITWNADAVGSGTGVALHWIEEDGPAVTATPRKGFGSRLLVASARQIDGRLDIDYAATGLRCRLDFTVPKQEADAA